MRSYDRLLLSGHYVLPLYHIDQQWVARSKRIGHPDAVPLYGYQLPAMVGCERAIRKQPNRFRLEMSPMRRRMRNKENHMERITIDVVSDVVCPWCYLGKARLELAIAEVQDEIGVDINWRPYQLNPDYPRKASTRRRRWREKLGGEERVARRIRC